MKKVTTKKPFDHSGSSFDSFLEDEGIRDEAETVAIKRVLAWQLEQAMREQRKTKQAMARELHTSRQSIGQTCDYPHHKCRKNHAEPWYCTETHGSTRSSRRKVHG